MEFGLITLAKPLAMELGASKSNEYVAPGTDLVHTSALMTKGMQA